MSERESMSTPFQGWLGPQAQYQAESFGIDYPLMREDADKRTEYVTSMLNAAFLELAEAQTETPWKPWMTGNRAEVWTENRGRFIGEVVDVLFFLANALCAVDCTDVELSRAYNAKMLVNEQRQVSGYGYGDGSKCAQCTRALDEPGAEPVLNGEGEPTFCSEACRLESDRLNRETLRGIGLSDARIDAIANTKRTTL